MKNQFNSVNVNVAPIKIINVVINYYHYKSDFKLSSFKSLQGDGKPVDGIST
ncbi:MAG: hypothetical protein ACTS8Y_04440 [Arsenophonus sp. ER-EMS1-MAG3]